MPHLVRRYLEGFGPATAQDIAAFGMLYAPLVRRGVEGLGDQVVTLTGPGRAPYYDLADRPLPDEDVPAPPRLLGMWDSTLLAYRDRSRIIPPEFRRHVIRSNGDTLPAVLVDGLVAGVWRPVDGGVEVTAFERLGADAWVGIEEEARLLVAFLASRDPFVYRRYGRWWPSLPSAEVRVVARP
jgi:hypothetical protein